MGFSTEPLGKAHDRSKFFCGARALDEYLRDRASQDAKSRVAAPFVHVDQETGRVDGYFTLSSFAIELFGLPEDVARKLPRYPLLPATLIGRLAVDRTAQGKGVGALLLVDALERSLEGSRRIASFAVIVDAKDEEALAFYRHFGFLAISGAPNRLFLPMRTIERLFQR